MHVTKTVNFTNLPTEVLMDINVIVTDKRLHVVITIMTRALFCFVSPLGKQNVGPKKITHWHPFFVR